MSMNESKELKEAFMAYYYSWQPVESPPDSDNWVAEKRIPGSGGDAVRHFEKGVEPTEKAIQLLCNKLNQENF